jgi:oligopeptide transport system substrate-binding protein
MGAVHEDAFEAHAAEMDQRFALVGISAIDAHTLRVRLTNPCPYFFDLLALPLFLPCHESIEQFRERFHGRPLTWEGLVVYDPQWTKPVHPKRGNPGLVTNGPYRLADWKFKRRARLEVNPFFRDAGSLQCRTVDMVVYDNLSAALAAYDAGFVDFLPDLNVPFDHEIARLARTGHRPDFHLCPVIATCFLNFNCADERIGNAPNPFVDRRVRQAFALAVDKQRIVEGVRGRGERAARTFIPPELMPGYRSPDGLGLDPERAKTLLAEAGFPNGQGLPPIQLLHTQSDVRVCQAIARMWADTLAVRVELQVQETKTFAEDKSRHRFMIARGNWYADYLDPTTFLNCLITGNGNNDSGYSNPLYDENLARAAQTADPAERAAILSGAEALITEEDVPILPLYHFVEPIAIAPRVRGVTPNPRLWISFRHVAVAR